MYKYRKELMFSKVDGLLKGKELALFFHYNNVNAKDWQKIRGELASTGEVPLLVVKNRVAKRRILPSHSLKPVSSAILRKGSPFDDEKKKASHRRKNGKVAAFDLLQGPTLLVGCNSLNDSKSVFSVLSQSGHFLLVGGIYNNKSINHSQLQRLLSLDTSLYTLLLQTLQTRVPSLLSLSQRYNFHFLTWYQRKLLFLLQQRLLNAPLPSLPSEKLSGLSLGRKVS